MKQLYEKKISELLVGIGQNGEDVGDYEPFKFIDPEDLKQWAIAIVKEYNIFRDCDHYNPTGYYCRECGNGSGSCVGEALIKFLIERFELTEDDLNDNKA